MVLLAPFAAPRFPLRPLLIGEQDGTVNTVQILSCICLMQPGLRAWLTSADVESRPLRQEHLKLASLASEDKEVTRLPEPSHQ